MAHTQTQAATYTPAAERRGPPGAGKKRRTLARTLKANACFLFILPALIIFLIFGLYTVIYSIALSFFHWNGFGGFALLPPTCTSPMCQFVGLDNFNEFLFKNPAASSFFWHAVVNNVIVMVVVTAATVAISLPLAMALNRAIRGQALIRTAIMLPMVTTGIAVFYVWTFIFNSDGLLNAALKMVGAGFLQASDGWLGDPYRALPALMLVMVWGSVPMNVLLYLTGLQTINPDYYDAARIDGANWLQVVLRITWPLLLPITVIVVILSINASLQSYEMVYLMTNGGPAGHTSVVGLLIFNYGFGDQRDLGIASAMAWLLFLVVFGISLLNLRLFRAKD